MTPTTDVIDAIQTDHARIKDLFDEVSRSSGDVREQNVRNLVQLLVAHETAEQEVVHPLTRKSHEAVAQARLAEEAKAEQVLARLEGLDVHSLEFDNELARLRGDVLRHAEQEERLEHPNLRAEAPADRLQQLTPLYEAAKAPAPTHPHPSGPQSAAGNLVVGPVVSVFDRVRDLVGNVFGSGR